MLNNVLLQILAFEPLKTLKLLKTSQYCRSVALNVRSAQVLKIYKNSTVNISFIHSMKKTPRKVIEFKTRPLSKREIVICKVYKSGIGMFVIILHIFEDKINDKFLGANQNIITSVDELIRLMKAII